MIGRTLKHITRDQERLIGVHPDLARAVSRILTAFDIFGWPLFVTEGVRSESRQIELFRQGRETDGKIITNADGVTNRSNHQVQSDGFGHAVDVAFLDDPDTLKVETYDPNQPWDLLALTAEKFGLVSGYRFRMRDSPHLEIPSTAPNEP